MRAKIAEKRAEALRRLQWLGIYYPAVKLFEEKKKVVMCDTATGMLSVIDNITKKRVRDFEKSNKAIVYFVIHAYNYMSYGEYDYFIFVGNETDIWDVEERFLKEEQKVFAAVNYHDPNLDFFITTIKYEKTFLQGILRI